MSRKTKRHKTDTENQNVEMHTEIPKNSNKLLIGSIAAGCGVAATIFLLTTDSGKRVRNGIQDRVEDLYDLVSEQVTSGWTQVRDLAQQMLSSEELEEVSEDIRRVA